MKNTEAIEPTKELKISSPPTGFQVIAREFMKDKLACFLLVSLIIVIGGIYIWADSNRPNSVNAY